MVPSSGPAVLARSLRLLVGCAFVTLAACGMGRRSSTRGSAAAGAPTPFTSTPSSPPAAAVPPTPIPPAPPARVWHHPASLADTISMDGNDSDSGSLAAGANGDAVLPVEYGSRLFVSERRGGGWQHPVRYVTLPHNPAGGSMFSPRAALRPDGATILAWAQVDGSVERIYASVYRNGSWVDPLGHGDHLSPLGGAAQQPWVAFDDNGDGVVVWEQYTTNGGSIFASTWRNGSWFNPTGPGDALSPLATHAQEVHLAVGPGGHVLVVWAQTDQQHYRVYKCERRNGVWTRPAGLHDAISPPGSDAFRPKAAFDAQGDAVVVWVQGDGAFPQVFKSELRAGTWRHPASLADNVSPDGTAARAAEVAMGGGEAVIVWRQDVSASGSSLFASEHRNGTWAHPPGLGARFAVGQHVDAFVLGMDAAGEVVVGYTAADAGRVWAMFLSERRAGTWTHAASLAGRINPGSTPVSEPAIAIDGTGAVMVAWRQSDGAFEKMYLSEYR